MPAGLCRVLQLYRLGLEKGGRESFTFIFLGPEQTSCFGPLCSLFCHPESEALPGTPHCGDFGSILSVLKFAQK